MKQKAVSSYMKMYKEKKEVKEVKPKIEETPSLQGIDFAKLEDWDKSVSRQEENINERMPEQMPVIEKGEEGEEIACSPQMSNETINSNNNKKESASLKLGDRIANEIDDDECNITQNQMDELDKEMNQMVKETKVKSYVENQMDKGIKAKKPKLKVYKNQDKGSNNHHLKASLNNHKPNESQKKSSNEQVKTNPMANNTLQEAKHIELNSFPQTFHQQMRFYPGAIQVQPIPNESINNYPYQIPVHPIPPLAQMSINLLHPQENFFNEGYANASPNLNSNYYYQQPPLPFFPQPLNQSPLPSSNKPASPQYYPKTMKEYKEKYSIKEKQLGGLGANIGSKEWEERQNKVNKAKQYSSKIKKDNSSANEQAKDNDPERRLRQSILPKCLNKKEEEMLKNDLLNDSFNEEVNDNEIMNKEKEDSGRENKKRPKGKEAIAHVNVIKKLKKEKEEMEAKDHKRNNKAPHKDIPNKKQHGGSNAPKHPVRLNDNTKVRENDDELTEKFMQMPCNNVIENLMQNHRAYNERVAKIKKYLNQ